MIAIHPNHNSFIPKTPVNPTEVEDLIELFYDVWTNFEPNHNLFITGSFVDGDGMKYDDLKFYPTARFSRGSDKYYTDGTFVLNVDELLRYLESFINDDK